MGEMRKEVLERRELQKNIKMRVFIPSTVVPMLLYCCYTWAIRKRHESKLQACEMMCLTGVEEVTRMDRVRNEEVRKTLRLRQEAVMDIASEGEAREVHGKVGLNE